MGIVTIFAKGGFLVYFILACSIFALSSFLDRLLFLQSIRINADIFFVKLDKLVRQERVDEAVQICDAHKSPVARIFKVGLKNMGISREKMQILLEDAALLEFPRLESKLEVLSTVAHICPLLGLLGTVNGMIRAFQVIQEKSQATGLASPGDLAQGIWMALITTALGLAVAIPTLVAYNFVLHKVQKIKHDMEKAATKALTYAS